MDLYTVWHRFLHGPREALRRSLGVCVPLYAGAFLFFPHRVPVDVVFGAPIEPLQLATPGRPTDDEVRTAHAAYIDALRNLFDEHKARFGYADREIEIV